MVPRVVRTALADFYERALLNGVIGVQKLRRHSHAHSHSHSHSHSHPHLPGLVHSHSHGHMGPDPPLLPGVLDTRPSGGEEEQGSVHTLGGSRPSKDGGSGGGGSDASMHRHTDSTHRNDSHPHYEYAPRHTTHIHLHNSHFHNVRAGCCW